MLDADTCIALLKRLPRDLVERLQTKAVGDVGISTTTLAEPYYGGAGSARRGQNGVALDQSPRLLDIATIDEIAADCCGLARAALEADGMPIDPLDAAIAGHAWSLNVVLVTHSVSDFRRVAGFRVGD